MSIPKVTIAVLSWNRLHYLRACLASAKRCIRYDNLEWIVSDNCSVEPGLREYINGLGWVDQAIFKRQSHAEAMNELVEKASGEYIMLWPEDIQFTVEGDWMTDVVEVLGQNPWIGSMGLNFLRKSTYRRLFGPRRWLDFRAVANELSHRGCFFRSSRIVSSSRGMRFRSFGWVWPGVVGSGIPSIARRSLWKALGPWKTRSTADIADSSLGAETDMVRRFYHSGMSLQQAMPIVPVAADIITDPAGTKAKVRGNKRYGVYLPPHGDFYYEISPFDALKYFQGRDTPLPFEGSVKPIGFTLPFDGDGNLIKSSINTSVVQEL